MKSEPACFSTNTVGCLKKKERKSVAFAAAHGGVYGGVGDELSMPLVDGMTRVAG